VTIYGHVVNGLLSSFKQSLLISFLVIFLLIAIYLRNIKLILLAMLTNVLPIMVMLGIMGLAGINLDMVTIPIGCLLMSIVVDDTIHFMHWYRKGYEVKPAIEQAGPGILFTTVLLGLGFSTLLLAEAPPVQYFALLSLLALGTALVADLVVLPSLLSKRNQPNE
jgi:predicted RND superfamily exporter protein